MNTDLISRQALCEYALNQKDKSVTPNDIMRFPSAQSAQFDVPDINDGDMISRRAAIDAICEYCEYFKNEDVIRRIKEIPSAQPEQRWIPCSERLPEDDGNYLVTYIYKDDKEGTEEPFVMSDIFLPWKGSFFSEEPMDKAQAWMPLPEPYRKEGKHEK